MIPSTEDARRNILGPQLRHYVFHCYNWDPMCHRVKYLDLNACTILVWSNEQQGAIIVRVQIVYTTKYMDSRRSVIQRKQFSRWLFPNDDNLGFVILLADKWEHVGDEVLNGVTVVVHGVMESADEEQVCSLVKSML